MIDSRNNTHLRDEITQEREVTRDDHQEMSLFSSHLLSPFALIALILCGCSDLDFLGDGSNSSNLSRVSDFKMQGVNPSDGGIGGEAYQAGVESGERGGEMSGGGLVFTPPSGGEAVTLSGEMMGAAGVGGGCVPGVEQCNQLDDDCDGVIDEDFSSLGATCEAGVGACSRDGSLVCDALSGDLICDATPAAPSGETCNDRDDDCDGVVDEEVPQCCEPNTSRACGMDVGSCSSGSQTCTANGWSACDGVGPSDERCDGADNDCDGQSDEGTLNACGDCGALPSETCNGRDDDCDGRVDEGTLNACGDCGALPSETCNGRDDDCDGRVDEGALNACGDCGATPSETCNGEDDDCDGRVDEGALNACGDCGATPSETCNGEDDDCDGRVDEGTLNACGGCGATPSEICNGDDDDCDGLVDETFNFSIDPRNCGQCGARCNLTRSFCVNGACRCGSGPECRVGYYCSEQGACREGDIP